MLRHFTTALLMLGSSIAIASAQTDTTATIASWNIEGYEEVPDARIEPLARGIVALDAEIIALQEVNPNDVAQKLVDKANELGAAYAAPVLLEQTASQNVAILFKTGVTVANPRFIEGSNLDNAGLRKALAADAKIGKFDFTIIVVHLKSGRAESEREIRSKQCKAIADFIKAETAAGEKDIVLLGDYNMIPGDDDASFQALNPESYLTFLSTAERERDFSNVNGNFLDGFAVSRRRMTEYIGGSFRVHPLHRHFRRTLSWYGQNVSDHLPLVARFDITQDRD
jgi:endonuclease/exonuclease/phosphatase family metal-dependent hydrolase